MLISVTEFKSNIGRYLSLVGKEDIIITKNGKQIARLTDIKDGKETITDSLIGVIPSKGIDLKAAKQERLARYEGRG